MSFEDLIRAVKQMRRRQKDDEIRIRELLAFRDGQPNPQSPPGTHSSWNDETMVLLRGCATRNENLRTDLLRMLQFDPQNAYDSSGESDQEPQGTFTGGTEPQESEPIAPGTPGTPPGEDF